MHHCLHVQEVVRCVADYLPRDDAFRLAITCKSLLEPCLDEVWREMHSLEPLIACLPEDLWADTGTQPQEESSTVTILDQAHRALYVQGDEDPIYPSLPQLAGMQVCEESLRELWIVGAEFVGRCLESFFWEMLDTLTLHSADVAFLPRLTALPRLRNLIMASSLSDAPTSHMPTSPSTSPKTFKSLRSLTFSMPHCEFGIRQMLPYIPRTKALQSLEWEFGRTAVPIAAYQDFMNALEEHADRTDLTHLKLRCSFWRERQPEAFDMVPQRIDLSPVRVIGSLETFSISLPHTLRITPTVIASIPSWWPRLRQLHLCPHLSSSCPPSIDHTHVLELCRSLPGLHVLGIQFDATWVTGLEGVVDRPSQLRKLLVGRSPICSPSAVLSFLRSNFPKLESLDSRSTARPKGDELFKKRWEAVVEGLKGT